jgi:hypothetical protein
MWRGTDAVIDAADLADAIDEVERGKTPEMLARLWVTEPHLARFLETAAANMSRPAVGPVPGMEDAMDYLLTVVRALELGHGRLWRDILPPLGVKE